MTSVSKLVVNTYPRADSFGAQFAVIINLAVESDGITTTGVSHRLAAAGQVNDRQPPVSQCGAVRPVNAVTVRPAMFHDLGGGAHPAFFRDERFTYDFAGDSTHRLFSLLFSPLYSRMKY
jgi:hypothetical protein